MAATSSDDARRRKGSAIALAGSIVVTPNAVLLRWAKTNGGTAAIIFWKLIFIATVVLAASRFLVVDGNTKTTWRSLATHFWRHKWLGLGCGACQAVRTVAMSYAFLFTFAARVSLLYSLHPLFVGVVTWLFIKDEVLPVRTFVALGLSVVALLVIFWPDITMMGSSSKTATHTSPTTQRLGDALAIITSVSVAGFLILSRHAAKHAETLSVPFSSAVGMYLAALGVLAVAGPSEVMVLKYQGFIATILCGFVVGSINLAFSLAPKFISATQVGLTSLIENILGPLWVYAVYREVPPTFTIIGGVLLVLILAGHEVAGALEVPIPDAGSSKNDGDLEDAKAEDAASDLDKEEPLCFCEVFSDMGSKCYSVCRTSHKDDDLAAGLLANDSLAVPPCTCCASSSSSSGSEEESSPPQS